MRDWRSAIVTVTVRDQRYREHDPILGVIPLKLSDLLQTSSQVTRWYPLDGGVGFGRIRISLLFRHVETKLPPNMLGWDVGTFEFASEKVTARGIHHRSKIRLRTGGSSGKITRHVSSVDGQDTVWDMNALRHDVLLPVKHRYRSPVVFEFHAKGKHHATGYAVLWLQHLVDNEDIPIDIPIWATKNGKRLTQNYITEDNWETKREPGLEDMHEIGRLQFTGRFKPGIDESHEQFVVDNNSRETFETWEACIAEGVRTRGVSVEVPEEVERMHEQSLVNGRDVLKHADSRERRQWLDKQGQDWSGAFGHDPRAYLSDDGKKIAEPGRDEPPLHPFNPPRADIEHTRVGSDSPSGEFKEDGRPSHEPQQSSDSRSRPSTGQSTETDPSSTEQTSSGKPSTEGSEAGPSEGQSQKANRRSEQRQQRGMMQWKPARNVVFARDEAKFAMRKVRKRFTGDLTGREPDIETETGT